MLEFRGSREAEEFINKKIEEGAKKKKEGEKVKGIGNESDEKSKKEVE
jgi:hypothetical protein